MSSSISSLPKQLLGRLDLHLPSSLAHRSPRSRSRIMTDYKLRYFNLRARGEPIRFVFHYAGIEFEDDRISFDDWPEIKPTLPFKQIPVLEFEDKQFFGALTICRYLGRQFGLAGVTDDEAVRCDEVADSMQDLITAWAGCHFEADEERKEAKRQELVEKTIPTHFGIFEECIEQTGGKYLASNGITWADLFVVAWLENILLFSPEALDAFPKLKELYEEVRSTDAIKAWIEKRPETQL